jgi:transcriptional regulator with XRE-family HTH domain
MSQIDQFLEALKKALKRKNIVYKDIAQKLNLSESSVKRILSSKSLTLERLEEICKLYDLQLSEIIALTDFEKDTNDFFYTDEQEKELAANPKLFQIHLLLDEGFTYQKILKDFVINENELQKLLLSLDKLNLIELHTKNRIRIPYKGSKRFKKEGAMGKLIFEQTRSNFLQSQFKLPNEFVRFQMGHMTPQTLAKIKTKVDKFLIEISEDFSYESEDNPEAETLGILVAMRPWQYAYMDSIKKHSRK